MNHIECFPSSLLNKNASSDRYISHCKSNAFHLNSFSMNFYIKHYCLLGALVSRLLIRTKQVFIFIKPCIYIFVYLCMYFIIYLRYLSKFFSMQMSQETQFLLINQVLTIGGIFFQVLPLFLFLPWWNPSLYLASRVGQTGTLRVRQRGRVQRYGHRLTGRNLPGGEGLSRM